MRTVRRLAAVALVTVLILAASTGSAFAVEGATGSISGFVVTSGTSSGISEASVEVYALVDGTFQATGYTVRAGFSGDYAISSVPAGDYQLQASDPSGRHYRATTGSFTVGAGAVTVDIQMAPAGVLTGDITDGSTLLAGVSVYLFDASDGGTGFPFPPSPDPGPASTDPSGVFAFPQVIDPLGSAEADLSGDYHAAAFKAGYEGRFYNNVSTLAEATPISMDVDSVRENIDFTLVERSLTPLAAKAKLNSDASSIPSDKLYVRRGGNALMGWYDSSLGGIVVKRLNAGGVELLVAPVTYSYDGQFDVNSTTVFSGEGFSYDPATAVTTDLGYPDIQNAQVVAAEGWAAFLYELPDATGDYLERTWRIRVFELGVGDSYHDFRRPMNDILKISPGGVDEGVVAITVDGSGTNGTSEILVFDAEEPGSIESVYSAANGGTGALAAESAIVWGGGTNVTFIQQAEGVIYDMPIASPTPSEVLNYADPRYTLSGIRAGGALGDFVFALTDFAYDPEELVYESSLRYWSSATGEIALRAATPFVNRSGYEPTFSDYDYAEAGETRAAVMRGTTPTDTYHVYSGDTASWPISWTRNDLDRWTKADHRAPDVAPGGGVAWLDWRTEASDLSFLPDVYYRKAGGPEKLIATGAYDLSEDIGLPQASARWVVYAKAGSAPDTLDFWAYDLTDDSTRLLKTVDLATTGGLNPITYPPLAGLTGDWLVYVGGADRTVTAELCAYNVLTGEERSGIDSIGSPLLPYQVYFKASSGKVLYADQTGETVVYDLVSDTKTYLAAHLPVDESFYSFEFDYPRAAYLVPVWETPTPNTDTHMVGTLKTFDFRTGEEAVLEDFFVIETGRQAGKPFALWKQALVAGSHVYDLNSGIEYSFDTVMPPAFVSIDATNAAFEISPDEPSQSGHTEADIYTLDLSAWVDVTPPVTSIVGLPSGLSTDPVSASVTALDTGSGVDYVAYRVDPGGSDTTGTSPAAVDFPEGTSTITYTSVDKWGNWDTTHTATVVWDAPPVTTFEITGGSLGSGDWYSTAVEFSLTATDTGSAVAQTFYTVDGGDPVAYSGTPVTVSSDGTHTVQYWSVDAHGTVESPRGSSTFKLDRTGPSISSDLKKYYEGSATITFSIADACSGLVSVSLHDGSVFNPWPAPWVIVNSTPGEYFVSVLAQDAVPNTSSYYETYSIAAVSTPETTLTGGVPAGWVAANVPISLVATDNASGQPGSGVANIKWRYLPSGSINTVTGASAAFTVSAQGTSTIQYWATDNVGTAETPKTAVVRIDKSGPTFSDDRLPSYSGVLDSTLTITATDPESLVTAFEYRLDGGVTQTISASPAGLWRVPVRITGAGSHTVQYWSRDGVGTITSGSSTLAFGKVATSITLRTTAYSSRIKKPFILTGVLTPGTAGDLMVVEVKKPGSGRWSYSSARLCFGSVAGGGTNWWYRYTPLKRGTYTFRSRYDANATRLGCYSPNTIAVRIR